jgi:hypothetical protein
MRQGYQILSPRRVTGLIHFFVFRPLFPNKKPLTPLSQRSAMQGNKKFVICPPCNKSVLLPSVGSSRFALRPCLELLCTNMLSETAMRLPSTLGMREMTTWKRRMSRGLPAFFRQFWLHFRKNLRKNLKHKTNTVCYGKCI